MIKGIGTDIVSIARIKDVIERNGDAFAKRILTKDELQIYLVKRDAVNWLAKRFAAKEAISKALGTGIAKGVSWADFQILNDELGAPMVDVSGVAKDKLATLGASTIHLSISDEKEFAVAFAVIE